jgi:Pyruvate/2-oxoacid:ferredoxin oxidoreductase delta subunit
MSRAEVDGSHHAHRCSAASAAGNFEIYSRLAEALNRHPEGFPRTDTGVEISILMKILDADDAELGSKLTHNMETAQAISRRIGASEQEAERRLVAMMRKGQVWGQRSETSGEWTYRMAPFIPGFYEEYMVRTRDMELLHLMEHYAREAGMEIMSPAPALQRVIPASQSLPVEEILPYDDVKDTIMRASSFAVFDCTCRVTRDMKGDRPCNFPIHNCLQLYYDDRDAGHNAISQQRALEILDEAEEAGLVHTGTNYIRGIHWICNCCGCCCNLIRNLMEEGLEGAIAKANYRAEAIAEKCEGCLACVLRCPVGAVSVDSLAPAVDTSRCIGCGLCVTGCPSGALVLKRTPAASIIDPPLDERDFNIQRLRARGLA